MSLLDQLMVALRIAMIDDRVAQLDDICNQHMSVYDPIGNDAESEMCELMTERLRLANELRESLP